MNLVVDTSVAVKWFVEEDLSDAAERLLVPEHTLIAPGLLVAEAANTLWKKVRRDEMDAADAEAAVAELLSGPIELQPTAPLVPRALTITRALAHPIYDCVYIAAAEASDAVLVTADDRLHEVCSSSSLTVATAHLGRISALR